MPKQNLSLISKATLSITALLLIAGLHQPVQAAPKEHWLPNRCSISAPPSDRAQALKPFLHVPSPDWAKQVIYMVQLDRFNDGEPERNDQGEREYDPSRESHYSGGDIRGVIEKIDYLKSLGVTTILLSPFIANKWVDPGYGEFSAYTGYHGYWPVSFVDMDAHYGSIEDLKTLSSRLHENGMSLLMDVVTNHTAHYYHYAGPYNPDDVTENFEMLEGQVPSAPTMAPFDQNDVRRPQDRASDIYHWTPSITNYFDPLQIEKYQLKLVNDLNTSNPVVRSALKEAYKCWIEEVGFDGIRIDAAKHVETDFWSDFLYAEDGLLEYARGLGKADFLTYGEIWNISPPFEKTAETSISEYMESGDQTGFRTAMGFPFFSSINKVINAYKPTDIMSFRLQAQMDVYPDPYVVVNFLNNHDVDRFLAGGDVARFSKALVILLTSPGLPLLYQGDEQGFLQRRRAMFAGGYLTDKDQFDENSQLYKIIKTLNGVRQSGGGVFTRGSFKSLNANSLGPGVLAFERRTDTHAAYVVVNTSSEFSTIVNALPTGLAPGSVLKPVYSVGLDKKGFVTSKTGSLTFSLPPDATVILLHGPESSEQRPASATTPGNAPAIVIDQDVSGKTLTADLRLTGRASVAGAQMNLILDGNADRVPIFYSDKNGKWSVTLPVQDMLVKPHAFELYLPEHEFATAPVSYFADRTPDHHRAVTDALGDDSGLTGSYRKPLHPAIENKMDIAEVQYRATETQMLLSIKMNQLTDEWSYPNGFENVSFQIFFDDGTIQWQSPDLPWIDAKAPEGFGWDLAHVVFGFRNEVYGNDKGEATQIEGVEPEITVAGKTINLRYDCSALPVNCSNPMKIYVTTWDRDQVGELRELQAEPDTWIFGRSDNARAKILDAVMVEP